MKRTPTVLIAIALSLVTARRLPAPIQELSPPPAPQKSEKPKPQSRDVSHPAAISEKDKKFMTSLADRVPEQMLLAKLAEKQASPDVINFSKQLISDRTAIDNDLRALAAKKGVALPKENISSAMTRNSGLGGLVYGAGSAGGGRIVTNWNKRWLQEMEKTLREDLGDCADEFQKGSDADVRAWSQKTFEKLKQHLLTLMDMRSKLK